jgi:predicted lipoprotein with Yx(FWY)xxD motif
MSKRLILAAALVLAPAVAGTAAASQQSGSRSLAAKQAKHAKSSRMVIKLRKTKLGKVLVTGSGRTLYLYTPDAKNKSNCYTGCASLWPPLISKKKARAGKGVKAKLIGVTMRTNGQHQVTYKGHPLYRYLSDSKAGQVKGEGYGGIWYVLNAKGKAVKHAGTSGGGGTTSTNRYGY